MRLLFGLLIWIVSVSFLFVPLTIVWTFKYLVIAFATRRKGVAARLEGEDDDEVEWFPFESNDCLYAIDSSWVKGTLNFGFILKLDKNPSSGRIFSVGELRDHFSSCFLNNDIPGGKYEKLSSYLESFCGHVFRVQKKRFDVKDHIRQVRFDGEEEDVTLEQYLSDWMLQGYKKRQPCWEVLLIDSVNISQSVQPLLAFKIHHALADGYSMLHILEKLTGVGSPYMVRDFDNNLPASVREMIECPVYCDKMSGVPLQKHVFRVIPSTGRHEYLVSYTSFPLDRIKKLRRKHGVHMASLIFALLIGALRKFLELDMGKQARNSLIAFGTTLPWPRHPSVDPQVLNKDKLCNHWVTGLGQVSMEEDRLVRLKKIEEELQRYQELALPKLMKRVIFPMFGLLPGRFMQSALSKDSGIALGLTSLVGGDNYSLLGCPVERIHPFIAVHDINPYTPLSCFTFSHSGRLEVTLGAHPAVFRDQATLDRFTKDYCHSEFIAMHD